jgi:hypothetical protein
MMAVIGTTLGAALLIAAGLYQLSPLKQVGLRKCQAPLMFFAPNWRKGYSGALRKVLPHELYCLGCLLGTDGAAVLQRRDGTALDRRACALRCRGKADPDKRPSWPLFRDIADRTGLWTVSGVVSSA